MCSLPRTTIGRRTGLGVVSIGEVPPDAGRRAEAECGADGQSWEAGLNGEVAVLDAADRVPVGGERVEPRRRGRVEAGPGRRSVSAITTPCRLLNPPNETTPKGHDWLEESTERD